MAAAESRAHRLPVVLGGFMGAGKSTVGALLARRMEWPFVDLDRRVESELGMTVAEIFRTLGEPEFRAAEAAALRSILGGVPSVVAVGGGTLCDDALRAEARSRARVFTLEVGPEEALRRIGTDPGRPRLPADIAGIREIHAARRVAYDDADGVVPTQGRTPGEVAAAVELRLREDPR